LANGRVGRFGGSATSSLSLAARCHGQHLAGKHEKMTGACPWSNSWRLTPLSGRERSSRSLALNASAFTLLLFGFVMTDGATSYGAGDAMVARIVTHNAPEHGPLETAFGVCAARYAREKDGSDGNKNEFSHDERSHEEFGSETRQAAGRSGAFASSGSAQPKGLLPTRRTFPG
jgi:hypothetical protein